MLYKIALSGKPGSGKDTVAGYLTKSDRWVRVSFADAVKDAALALDPYVGLGDKAYVRLKFLVETVGWDEAKRYDDVRRLLQRMGYDAGRDIHGKDCWLNIANEKAYNAWLNNKSVVFSDVRFMNEFTYLKEHGYTMVKLERDVILASRENLKHKTECDLDTIPYKDWDFIIHNNGTLEQLNKFIDKLVTMEGTRKEVYIDEE